MRIALRSSCVHLEASSRQDKARPHTSCCLVAFIPSPQSLHVSGASLLLNLGELRQYGSVGDRHAGREFKLVPYSGGDEHCPQWVLKFEA